MKKLFDFLYIVWIALWVIAVIVMGSLALGMVVPLGY